jgi:hypothetical protein
MISLFYDLPAGGEGMFTEECSILLERLGWR